MKISIWPDGTYCEKGEEETYLRWMSDDYCTIDIDEYTLDALERGEIEAQELIG